MSPRTSEQFDKIRQEKKELILNTALELFAENGYHATSISQIAKKAGISKGLAYNYFESKKEILDEIITKGFNTIFENFDLDKDGIISEEEFFYFISYNFKLLRENLKHWKLFFSLMLQPAIAETFTKDYKEKGAPMFQMLYNFLKSKGSENPDGDLMVLSALLEGAFLYQVVAPDIFPPQQLEENVIRSIHKFISTYNNSSSKS